MIYRSSHRSQQDPMDFASLLGIISGLGLIVGAIALQGPLSQFIHGPSAMIVVGGTIAATLLTFPFRDVWAGFRAAVFVFQDDDPNEKNLIEAMVELSRLTRRQGLLALQDIKTESPFLKRACTLIADSADEASIRESLRIEIESLKKRHYIVHDVFRKMSGYAPAFGMLGTLIGLVQMLAGLNDPSSVGPAMSVALLTTFYGSLLSTVIFLPIAGKLKARTLRQVHSLEIIFEGASCILENNNPLVVHEKLSSFLAVGDRRPMKKQKGGPG